MSDNEAYLFLLSSQLEFMFLLNKLNDPRDHDTVAFYITCELRKYIEYFRELWNSVPHLKEPA